MSEGIIMIISGIYWRNSERKNLLASLNNATTAKIKDKVTYLESKNFNIIAGNTSIHASECQILKCEGKILIGTAFSNKDNKKINKSVFYEMSHKREEAFIKKYWGDYIFIEKNEDTLHILRSLTGKVSLYYIKTDSGNIVFSSEISILRQILSNEIFFNYEYLSSVFLQSTVPTINTLFIGINELSFGCELKINQHLFETNLAWNPLDYCQPFQDEDYFIKKITNTLLSTLETLADPLENILLEFSGGLDSSALLLCLKHILRDNQKLTAINIFDSSVESSNERIHAKKIAKEAGIDLIEVDFSNSLPFSFSERLNYQPNKPSLGFKLLKLDQKMAHIAQNYKGARFISGHGGDHIFMCPPPIESLVDLVIDKNFNLKQKLTELSLHYREPFYPLLKIAFKNYFLYLCGFPYKSLIFNSYTTPPWIKDEVHTLSKMIRMHPFYEIKNKRVPPGKFSQINAIYNGLTSIKKCVINENNPILYPLFTQPMLELALSAPSYKLYSKEFDRYHLRKAIHNLFNTESVWRTDKGSILGVIQLGFRKNIKKITELCLEGNFAREGLIEKDLLWENIKKAASGHSNQNVLFLDQLVNLEMFLTYWE